MACAMVCEDKYDNVESGNTYLGGETFVKLKKFDRTERRLARICAKGVTIRSSTCLEHDVVALMQCFHDRTTDGKRPKRRKDSR